MTSWWRNSSDVTRFCYHCVEYIKLDTCTKFHDHRSNNNKVMMGGPHDWRFKESPCQIGLIICMSEIIKGRFPVMAEITHILAANIRRQRFFVITTTASTRCLVEYFQLICYSQRVNARHNTTALVVQDVQNGRTIGWLQWWSIADSLYKEKRLQRKMAKDNYWIGVQENIGMFSKS